jgi:hypothetical protein
MGLYGIDNNQVTFQEASCMRMLSEGEPVLYAVEAAEREAQMNLVTEPYLVQVSRWPASGRHILAQFDDESVIVYQAYRPGIGHFVPGVT